MDGGEGREHRERWRGAQPQAVPLSALDKIARRLGNRGPVFSGRRRSVIYFGGGIMQDGLSTADSRRIVAEDFELVALAGELGARGFGDAVLDHDIAAAEGELGEAGRF